MKTPRQMFLAGVFLYEAGAQMMGAIICAQVIYAPAISPPSCLVTATTDGRGGMPLAKSGQRVLGAS
jgi:hypothetical protein